MQIHELNSFSGTPSANDYLVTDNGTDTSKIPATELIAPAVNAVTDEVATRQSADALLQSQIDQLVAPTGTAPNPAEIENARIGADNVTYTTLGEAIRTQVTDVKSALNESVTDLKADINSLAYEGGLSLKSSDFTSGNWAGGAIVVGTQRICTKARYEVHKGDKITYHTDTLQIAYGIYATSASTAAEVYVDWHSSAAEKEYVFPIDGLLFVQCRKSNDAAVNPSEYDADALISNSQLLNQIKQNESHISTFEDFIKDRTAWGGGYWGIADGTYADSNNWARSNQILTDDTLAVSSTADYGLFLLAYDGTTYIGTWDGLSFVKSYNYSLMARTYYNLADFREKYPTYSFRMSIRRADNTAIDLDDLANAVTLVKSKPKANEMDIAVIRGDFAKREFWENGSIRYDGVKNTTNGQQRLNTIHYLCPIIPITIIPKSGYTYSVTEYLSDGTFLRQFSSWQTVPYTLSSTDRLYMVSIKAANNANLAADSVSSYIETVPLRTMPLDRPLAECANVKAINHRGYNKIAPENTLPAFEMSALYGYKYVETDVLFTSDGVPVLMHDASINRTARNADGTEISGTVNIADITYEQALTYDYGIYMGTEYAGTKIPTFAEFMHCCKALNLHPWIELKNEKTYSAEEIALIISIVRQYGMEEHVSFISFSYDALALVKDQWDSVELGLNGSVANANLLKTGKNRVFMIYSYSADISSAVNAGYQVCFYTVDSLDPLIALTTNAYDSVLTDNLLPSQIYNAVRYKYENS